MAKITLEGFILVPNDDIEQIERELKRHTDLTHQEPGCITFEVTRSMSNPNRFDVYEEFIDRTAFDRHQTRVKASRWGEVSVNVKRHYQITEEKTND